MIATAMARDSTSASHPRWTILYDADCGFCRTALAAILTADRDRRLRPLALGTAEADRLLADLTPEQRAASWHLVSPDGHRESAGAAGAPLLRLLPGGALPAAALAERSGADRARLPVGRRSPLDVQPRAARQSLKRPRDAADRAANRLGRGDERRLVLPEPGVELVGLLGVLVDLVLAQAAPRHAGPRSRSGSRRRARRRARRGGHGRGRRSSCSTESP